MRGGAGWGGDGGGGGKKSAAFGKAKRLASEAFGKAKRLASEAFGKRGVAFAQRLVPSAKGQGKAGKKSRKREIGTEGESEWWLVGDEASAGDTPPTFPSNPYLRRKLRRKKSFI